MLAFFRRILSSWMAVALLGVILIAFIATGVGTPGGGLIGAGAGDAIAVVGGRAVPGSVIAQRAQNALGQARQQQPTLTMPQFLSAIGGLGPIVEQYVGATILSVWGEAHGLAADERLIGGEIASYPVFHSTTGQFDQNVMNSVLAQRRMSFAQLHADVSDDLIRRQLITPITSGVQPPEGILRAYAQLVIDRREGAIGVIPAKPDGIAAPSEADVAQWYKGNIARYSLPERRALRYAMIGPETVTAPAPTDAEIAAQYQKDSAKYAASETRTILRVVLPDQAAATAFAAKVKGGTAFAAAAAQSGLAAADITLGAVTKQAFAGSDGQAIADAAFALPSGGTTAPVKSALGWAVAHVDAIKANAARSLAQARPEIAAALTKTKSDAALAKLVQQVEDEVGDGASFNEVVAKHKLAVVTTPPLQANGTAPGDAAFKPDPVVPTLLHAAGDAEPEDQPTVETIDPKVGRFALLSVASVVPAAPTPLAQAHDRVVQDIVAKRAADRAHGQAQAILAKVNAGQPIAAAFAAAGLPAPQPIALTQLDLSRAGQNVPPPVRLLFRLTPGKADLMAMPNGNWFVARLDRITPGDPKALSPVIGATRGELTRSLGEEYIEQFVGAARGEVKVTRYPAAVAKLEQQLRGNGSDSDSGQ